MNSSAPGRLTTALALALSLSTSAALAAERAAPAAESDAAPAVERHSPREGSPSLGPLDAKTTLIFFMDFQCPVCPRAAREMQHLVADMNGALRVELHHNPLAMHRDALQAAAASRAAQRQGKFWEYHDLLLMTGRYDRETLISLAAGLRLDQETFVHDMDDQGLREGILREAEEAKKAGADATPGFLINGHVEVGWASLPWLEEVVRREMAKATALKTSPGRR